MELWDIYDGGRNKTGRTVVRGQPLSPGEYHLVVDVWIRNGAGQFLISRRAAHRPLGGCWEATGGSAITGEDSLAAALREVREELGLALTAAQGRCLFTLRVDERHGGASYFRDVWLFCHEADLRDVRCQPEEVSDARWATTDEIGALHKEGVFTPAATYLDRMLALSATTPATR